MSLTAKQKGGGGFDPIDEGTYTAICYGLVDIGEQAKNYKGQEKTAYEIVIIWEILDSTITIDGEEKPRAISKTYTLSLHEKSGLRKDLKSWRGREFTQEELDGFNMENIVGAPCLINIVHAVKDDKTYANISSIMALPKGMAKPKLTNPKLIFNIDTAEDKDLERLPEWLQKKVTESATWKAKKLMKAMSQGDGGGKQAQFMDLPEDDGDLPF